MKTHDEIKKGLEICTDDEKNCTGCPYEDAEACYGKIMDDAFWLIEKLEVKAPKWISVEERVPEQGQRVLFYTAGNNAVYIGLYLYTGLHGAVWFTTTTNPSKRNGGTYTATHWMPLPEPPECKENGGIES